MLRLRFILLLLMLTVLPLLLPQLRGQDQITAVVGGSEDRVVVAEDPVQDTLNVSARGERESSLSGGADLISSYIWRGFRQGRGPHIQPFVEYSAGGFTGGVWSTFDFNGYREIDIYMSVELPGGFNLSLQDYYIADLEWSDFSAENGSHAIEAGIGFEWEHINLSANYIVNEAGGAGSYGGDLYLESRLSFDYFTVFMGAGNGWHTEDGRFNVCNIGLEVSREIAVNDSFAIPVTAAMVFNPDSETLFFSAGISFSKSR